jgi:hypothetical protein
VFATLLTRLRLGSLARLLERLGALPVSGEAGSMRCQLVALSSAATTATQTATNGLVAGASRSFGDWPHVAEFMIARTEDEASVRAGRSRGGT